MAIGTAAVAVAVGLAAGPAAAGAVVDEAGDAGALPGTAQVVEHAVDAIVGTLATDDDVDVYRLCVGEGGLHATTQVDTDVDTYLAVFTGTGLPVAAIDDDEVRDYQSTLDLGPDVAPAGEYLVAVASWVNDPRGAADERLFYRFFPGPVPVVAENAEVPLAGWNGEGRDSGPYTLTLAGTVDCTVPTVEVPVTVKGGDDAPVNTRSKGRTPVVVHGTDDLDVTTVDPASIGVGPAGAPLDRAPDHDDVDGDGRVDLVLHVRTQALGLAPGDDQLCVVATTDGGVPVTGCAPIRAR